MTTRCIVWMVMLTPALPCNPVHAQAALPDPVHWSATARLPGKATPGLRFDATLRAAIDAGWHLYALPEKNVFPLATEIALVRNPSADLMRVNEQKPVHSVDADSHVVTAWFATSAIFTLHLATAAGTPRDLQVAVRYQACNDRMCLPPRQITVPVMLSTGP